MQSTAGLPGIIDSKIYSDGRFYDVLYTDGGVSQNGQSGKVKMLGPSLFKHAVEKMSESVMEILQVNNMTPNDIDYFIPHQANIRIIDSMAERLKFSQDKIVKTVATHANCSAASIPLALSDLKSSGNLKKGDIILFTAIGAGLTWGSALIRW
jgi:3-oxoacyl-[acyl-carrier-protein] synthase-3